MIFTISLVLSAILFVIVLLLKDRNDTEDEKKLYNEWHNNPDNWKFNFIYYNLLDKRIFPPKRFKGMGWTINFANPNSTLVFILILVLCSAPAWFMFLYN